MIERANVSEVLWDGDRVMGVGLADGRSAHAAIVVGADGRHSLVARQVSADLQHEAPAYDERIAQHRGLAPRVAAAATEGRLAGCGPERSYARVPCGPGWALVGDAAMHQDPWSGLGIDMAGVHATFLAEAIIGWLQGSVDERTAQAGYHERRDAHGLAPYHDTVRFAADLRALGS